MLIKNNGPICVSIEGLEEGGALWSKYCCALPLLGSRHQVKAVSLRLIADLGGVETTYTHTHTHIQAICLGFSCQGRKKCWWLCRELKMAKWLHLFLFIIIFHLFSSGVRSVSANRGLPSCRERSQVPRIQLLFISFSQWVNKKVVDKYMLAFFYPSSHPPEQIFRGDTLQSVVYHTCCRT